VIEVAIEIATTRTRVNSKPNANSITKPSLKGLCGQLKDKVYTGGVAKQANCYVKITEKIAQYIFSLTTINSTLVFIL
jgi:hypothetical protein